MAAPKLTFDTLRRDIKAGKLAPVYILHGEEGYFTDELVKAFEGVIPEADREFNQYILYAPQVLPGEIMDICRRFPMMAERQLVIVKEAQAARATEINKLHRYCVDPSPTTVLVIVFRGEKASGKDLLAAVRKTGVIFESAAVRDYQIGSYISNIVKEMHMNIDPKALEMLKDYIGTSVSKMYNEIDKLHLILGDKATITPESVERNIGISKDYNSFELVDAIAAKDAAKVTRITEYFASNPKAYPALMVIPAIFDFFSNLLIVFYTRDKSTISLKKELNINWDVQLRKYLDGMRNYNAFQVIEIIWALRQADTRIKGNGSRQDEYSLFRDLMYHILSAPGDLGVGDLYIK